MAVVSGKSARDRLFDAVNVTLISAFTLVVLYPLVYILTSSVSEPELVSRGKVWLLPKGLNIGGYVRVFQDSEILLGYRNTVFYTVAGTLVNLVTTLPAAYALSRRDLVGRNPLMFLMAFTMYFSGGIVPTFLVIKRLGLLNTWSVLIISNAVTTYNLIIARTFFAQGVPLELEEAAFIDGCSMTRTFLTIVLPLSRALIGVLTLYYGVAHWNSWFSAMIYLTDRAKVPLQLVLREILVEQQMKAAMFVSGDPMADELVSLQVKLATLIRYCVIVVSSAPVIIVYPFLQKYFDKGIMLGSIKG